MITFLLDPVFFYVFSNITLDLFFTHEKNTKTKKRREKIKKIKIYKFIYRFKYFFCFFK